MKDYHDLVQKVHEATKDNKLDLSSDEDLSIGIMNLISIEEHLFFTAEKTDRPEYYEMLTEIREMRKTMLKRIVTEYEGEVWCISKHLLAGSMRMMEVGTKALGKGKDEDAQMFFKSAFELYSMFWAINLMHKAGEKAEEKKESKHSRKVESEAVSSKKGEKGTLFARMGDVVKKAVDCCKE